MFIIRLIMRLVKSIEDFLEKESKIPPYPFDDDEGQTMWRDAQEEHDASEKLIQDAKDVLASGKPVKKVP